MTVTIYCPICGTDISRHTDATLKEHWADWTKKRDEIDEAVSRCVPVEARRSFWFGYGRPDV
jgi:hypothetical protein